MHNKNNLKLNIKQRRLIYETKPEKPDFIIEPQKKKENKPNPETSLRIERQESKKRAVSEGKKDVQESFQIRQRISGIKLNSEKLKIGNNGMVEQPFEFGDTNVPGKILIPPDIDPNKKVNYIFNYVNNPDKYDQSKLLETIQKNKDKIGNTIVITLKTPDNEVQINGQKFETIQRLSSEVESLQERFKSNPQLSHLVLPDTNQFLFMSDPSEVQKLSSQLTNFYQTNQNRNLKFPKEPQIWSNQPETFAQQLSEYLDQSTEDNQENEQVTVGGGGGGSFGGGGSSEGSEQISTESESSSTENIPENTGNTPESTEQTETSSTQLDKLLIIGDSLMTGVENKLRANDKLKKAKVGKFTSEMLNDMKSLDQSKQLESYRNQTMVINGGINDIAAGKSAEEIYSNLQQIWGIAKKYNILVYTCTVTPFKGYPAFKNNFETKEKERTKLNDLLISREGSENGPQKLIMLHKRKSEGGLANDNDLSELDPSFEGPDHLHLKPTGYDKMSEIIQSKIGIPQEKPASNEEPKSSSSSTQLSTKTDTATDKPEKTNTPSKSTEEFKVTSTDRLAADQYLKEVKRSANPSSRIGEIRRLPGGKILRVAWHTNHEGQWGTESYKEKPGRHIGVQVEKDPNQRTT